MASRLAAVWGHLQIAIAGLACVFPVSACGASVPLPPHAIELNAAGARALAEGRLSVAEARLSVALEYSPRFVEAWVNLGYVELGRGNFEQARRDFLKARDLNPNLATPHHGLGVLADEEGRGEEAEGHYRAALKVDPGFVPARANLARRLFARGQYENAREQFERLIEVEPSTLEGWVGEAESLLQLGRGAQADETIARAVDRFGTAMPLRLLLARQNIARGEWVDAEATLAPLVGEADQARAGAAWGWIAVARIGRGDASGACDAARAAVATDADDAVARYVVARLACEPKNLRR